MSGLLRQALLQISLPQDELQRPMGNPKRVRRRRDHRLRAKTYLPR